jgi:hypothetical protein
MFVTYGPLNPETDNFVGRAAELKQMEGWLATVRNYGAVVGARQTGKTSLLLKLRHDLQAKYGFVFVDLMELHGIDVAQCYQRLSKEVVEQLEDVLNSKGLEPATNGAEFHDFLKEVARRSRLPRLTLILDEVGALPREAAQSLANAVRAVFTQRHIQQPFGKFVFIFSGSTDILELTSGEASPLRNVTENLYVPDFSPDETAELVATGLEEEGLAADPAIGGRVYEWTHGHPYLSQRVGALVLEMVEERHPLAVELVDKAVERLRAGDVNLQYLIRRLQAAPEAQAKVGEILQPGSRVRFSRNDPILSHLEIGGVIRDEKGWCVIRNRIYDLALAELVPQGEFRYDAFISYSHKNSVWVRNTLLPRLEHEGLRVCIDFRDFEPGAPSLTEMERAVLQSRKTLLVLTPDYLASEWAEFENILASTLDPAARKRHVIPLLLKPCELPLRVRALNYLDFTRPHETEFQFQRLVATIR